MESSSEKSTDLAQKFCKSAPAEPAELTVALSAAAAAAAAVATQQAPAKAAAQQLQQEQSRVEQLLQQQVIQGNLALEVGCMRPCRHSLLPA
jgi:hypothetical protein